MRGWFQSASHLQQRHHGSPPIVSLGHVWFVFFDWCIQQTWFPVVHIVMLGTYFIYLYRAEVILWRCVHFHSTCFWVSCGYIVEISLCGVWVGCIIPPYLGVPIKAHNFMNCIDLIVLTKSKHPHGLATLDLNVSIGLISHNNVKDT